MSDVPFRKVCRVEDVPDGRGITVQLDNSELAIFRDKEKLWCTEGRCPHAFELMSKAVLENGTVECLAHHYCYELTSGKAIKPIPGAAFLKLYPLKVEDGDVLVAFEGGDDEW
ncbi:MAG TPA: Rieske 2Fe-2S domain-containing protein [bacterium]|jgi:nitrite reductase/ring-hydroxylating ferredoxin subunit